MRLITDETGLMRDEDGSPRAELIDSFVTGAGVGAQSDVILLRLLKKPEGSGRAWRSGEEVHPAQVRQFALHARRAEELAHELLALAALAKGSH